MAGGQPSLELAITREKMFEIGMGKLRAPAPFWACLPETLQVRDRPTRRGPRDPTEPWTWSLADGLCDLREVFFSG